MPPRGASVQTVRCRGSPRPERKQDIDGTVPTFAKTDGRVPRNVKLHSLPFFSY